MKKLSLLFILLFNINPANAQQINVNVCNLINESKLNLIQLKSEVMYTQSKLKNAQYNVDTDLNKGRDSAIKKGWLYGMTDLFFGTILLSSLHTGNMSQENFYASTAAAIVTLGFQIYSINLSLDVDKNLIKNRDEIKNKLNSLIIKFKSEESKIAEFEKKYCMIGSPGSVTLSATQDAATKALLEANIIAEFKANNSKSAINVK